MARRTERRRTPITVLLSLAAAGCVTSQQASDTGRAGEYHISCGYFGWYMCYERADQLCPSGYKVVSEEEDHFGGRKTRIACQNRETP
jgi:hypothetical protein